MPTLRQILYGDVTFLEGEEYRAFQFRFLCILMLAGAVVTGLLLLGVATGINTLHVVSMAIFMSLSLLLWLALRGRPHLLIKLA